MSYSRLTYGQQVFDAQEEHAVTAENDEGNIVAETKQGP